MLCLTTNSGGRKWTRGRGGRGGGGAGGLVQPWPWQQDHPLRRDQDQADQRLCHPNVYSLHNCGEHWTVTKCWIGLKIVAEPLPTQDLCSFVFHCKTVNKKKTYLGAANPCLHLSASRQPSNKNSRRQWGVSNKYEQIRDPKYAKIWANWSRYHVDQNRFSWCKGGTGVTQWPIQHHGLLPATVSRIYPGDTDDGDHLSFGTFEWHCHGYFGWIRLAGI